MEQSRGGGFFWAKVSRGDDERLIDDRAHAQWEPVYRESALHAPVVLGDSRDYAIWEWGPRISPPEDLPRGAFDGDG